MHRGYIKLWRKSLDSTLWQNHNLWRFWTYCLLKASHSDHTEMIGFQEVELKTGEFVFGRKVAAKETGLSEQNIRTSISCLKSTNNITIKVTNKFSIIHVQNWEVYQETNQQINHQNNQLVTSKSPATNQQLTTNKNDKNDKNDENTLLPQNAFQIFGTHFQPITDKTADKIKDAIEFYSETWVIDALNEAKEHNARNWNYVEVILKRWKQDGRNGKPSGRIPPDGVYHTIEELVGPVTYEDEETEAQA